MPPDKFRHGRTLHTPGTWVLATFGMDIYRHQPYERGITGLLCLLFTVIALCSPNVVADEAIPVYNARIINRYPHDPNAFTQGLLYFRGKLYESTGLHGQSSVRRVDINTGHVVTRLDLPVTLFGEGVAQAGSRLFQLTWKRGIALVYSLPELRRIGRRSYAGEGWGLTWNGRLLIMSDGSAVLRFMNPDDFNTIRRLTVTRDGRPVARLNELEYACGDIWANIRYADTIVRIDPKSGKVIAAIDATKLRQALPKPGAAGVLNGIAWDQQQQRLFVTGKNWPLLFQVAIPGGCE